MNVPAVDMRLRPPLPQWTGSDAFKTAMWYAIALASPNVYVSPDVYISTASMPVAQVYIDAANLYLGDRLLWGTAYPSRGHVEAMRDVRTFHWTPGTLEKALWHNPARLLRL